MDAWPGSGYKRSKEHEGLLRARERVWERHTYVNALMGETRRYGRALFFGFAKEDGEFFDSGHGDVSAIVASQKGLFGSRSVIEQCAWDWPSQN